MFQRARGDGVPALAAQKHLPKSSGAAAEEQLNKRLDGEIRQLLTSFGEIIQSSRVENSEMSSKKAAATPNQRGRESSSTNNVSEGEESDESDAGDASAPRSKTEPIKDKYVVAQEAYSAQTRAATMVRSVENLLGMVADIKRAYLVNDTAALTMMADRRRKVLEARTLATRKEIEELGSVLDAAVRDLEKVYYNSKYLG
ncbi:hypothetical protein GGI01_003073 [Coemansia sp. RSA 376]|nr:hypothetical protein LPJ71_006001 [Coemansia sp. S17]KAJ2018770.1 hypothetical protein GGI14_002049 [Coemansia sp. S680]KAJ2037990.1 hypothetical protein H4S03_002622 [Coemansia sp. S3946]KAJ2054061.1 hypothetical protein H4S04_000250 [Coemansia sp. S16]KAJ2260320.1 hypothetical protein GGI01_003073 [Coemansia sp. RSA 376]KAJ2351860.1 hypothetical protein GGH92_001591 [Coemansia sp. RSA 2673]KAJ2420773.1 hypothetical protein GGF41_004123 [Coemansia sp. RSA 2531]